MKKLIGTLIFAVLLIYTMSWAWDRDQKHTYTRYDGLTGGGGALDALSSLSMMQYDRAAVYDDSGNSVYFFQVVDTGTTATASASGTTLVCPDDLEAGGSGSGTSTWEMTDVVGGTLSATSGLQIAGVQWNLANGQMVPSLVQSAMGTGTNGTTVYGTDGSSVSGASNIAIVLDPGDVIGGTSTSVVSDGKGGATAYVGGYSSGDSVYFVGGNFRNEINFVEPSTDGGYSGGTAFNIGGLKKSELNIGENVMQTLYDTDHDAQTDVVIASVSGYSTKGGTLRPLNVNLGQNRYNAAWQSTSIAEGTDAAPSVNYIYLEESGGTVVLTDSTDSPEGKRYIHVGEMILGDVDATGATIYLAHSQNAYLKKFAHEVMDRFHEQGAFYLEGFDITSTNGGGTAAGSGVSITSGEFMDVVKTIECSGASTNPLNSNMANMGSSAAGMFFIKNNGDYTGTTGFRFHDEYSDGGAIASNKYYNINIGIVQSGLTTSGATPFRLYAMVQKGASGDYGTFNAAFADEFGQEVSTPSVGMIRHIYIPIARLIAKAGVLQAFPDGNYHQDIRNRAQGGGAGQTVKPSPWGDDGSDLAPVDTRTVSSTKGELAVSSEVTGEFRTRGAVGATTGVSLVANYQTYSIGVNFPFPAYANDTVEVPGSSASWTLTGVSLMTGADSLAAGVSVYMAGAVGVRPDTGNPDLVLVSVSGDSATSMYNHSDSSATQVAVGKGLIFKVISVDSGVTLSAQVHGTKD